MGGPSDTGTIDFPFGDGHDSGREIDAATTVSAAAVAFNNAALPPDMPDWFKSAIRAEAFAIIDNLRDDEIRLTDAQRKEDEQDNRTHRQHPPAEAEEQYYGGHHRYGRVTHIQWPPANPARFITA